MIFYKLKQEDRSNTIIVHDSLQKCEFIEDESNLIIAKRYEIQQNPIDN
jgi:hypothetical protein